MTDENKKANNIAKTIALPALLVISLLAARLVMHSKTGIRMSGLIELNRSGLSVSMPSGNGWQCEETWSFENSSFVVRSRFAVSRLSDRSYAQCRYLLAAGEETPQERLGQEYPGTKLVVTGQSTADNLTVNWVSTNIDTGVEIILGFCELDDGRQLEIAVVQNTDEHNPAKDIFENIVKSIRFSSNGLLQAGARLISGIRDNGLDITAYDSSSRPMSLFTIADAHKKTIGFTMNAMALAATDANTAINAADYYYLRGLATAEEIGIFRGSSDLRQFVWQVRTISRMNDKVTEMTADTGKLKIRRLRTGSPFDRRTGRETDEYELGETVVPDIILEPVLTGMLDSNEQAVLIDVIRSDGDIMPVYIQKTPKNETQDNGSSITLEWLDERTYRQTNYYNDSKKLIKISLQQENTYTLTASDANEIAKIFPERADLVNDKKEFLDGAGL